MNRPARGARGRLTTGAALPIALAFLAASPGGQAQAPKPSADDGALLEEVIVTAQRREQQLIDVPLSVTALRGEELEKLGALDLAYLAQVSPNTTIEPARGTNNALAAYIRGVGQQDHIAGFESGVGLYVDDVYFNRPQLALLDIYDVERIEVLRGPQGTLYGRNTVGGAIKYVSRRLGDAAELRLRGRLGDYGMRDAILTGSVPLADALRIGGSIASLNLDGFGDNLQQPGLENYNKKVNAARMSAEWEPGEDWFIRLAGDWLQDDSDLRHGHRLLVGGFSGAPVLDDVFDTRAGLTVPVADAEAEGVSLLLQWAAWDAITLRGIFASRRDETWKPVDLDGLPTVDLESSTWDRNDQDTVELQAVFDTGRWSGVAGFFALDASAATRLETVLGLTGDFIGLPGLNNQLQSRVETRNWALYTDLGFDFSEQWRGSVGARYTHDQRSATILRQILLGGLSPYFGGTGVALSRPSDFNGAALFEKITPRASIQWLPGAGQNLYLSYSEGFKGGGFDPRGLTSKAPDLDGDGQVSDAELFEFMKFDPERVSSWEAGWKASLLGGRMSSRLAIFKADYTDVQIPGSVLVTIDGIPNYIGITTNAADADIKGIEWEGQAVVGTDLGIPGSRLELTWAIGLIDAAFNEFVDEDGNDVAHERGFANTPDWTAGVAASYSLPVAWLGVAGNLAIIAAWTARDDQIQFEEPDPLVDQPAYALWDLSVVWSDVQARWQVGLHGKNLADKAYKVAGLNIYDLGLENNVTAFYGNPRQFWLDLQYRFR